MLPSTPHHYEPLEVNDSHEATKIIDSKIEEDHTPLTANEFILMVSGIKRNYYLSIINKSFRIQHAEDLYSYAEDILQASVIKILNNQKTFEAIPTNYQQKKYFKIALLNLTIDYLRREITASARKKMLIDIQQSIGQLYDRKALDEKLLLEIFQARLTPEEIGKYLPLQNTSADRLHKQASKAAMCRDIIKDKIGIVSGKRLKTRRIHEQIIEHILMGMPTNEIAQLMNNDPKSPVYQKYSRADGRTDVTKFSNFLYKTMARFHEKLAEHYKEKEIA